MNVGRGPDVGVVAAWDWGLKRVTGVEAGPSKEVVGCLDWRRGCDVYVCSKHICSRRKNVKRSNLLLCRYGGE